MSTEQPDDDGGSAEYYHDDCGESFDSQQAYASHFPCPDADDDTEEPAADGGSTDDADAEETATYECPRCGDTFDSEGKRDHHEETCVPQDGAASAEYSFIVDAGVLDEYINYIDPLLDETVLLAHPDGMLVVGVDAANVGMVVAELDASAFESLDVPNGYHPVGISLDRLDAVLAAAADGVLVKFEYDPETKNYHLQYGGHEWRMSLIDPKSIRKTPDIPDLDLPAELAVTGEQLQAAVAMCDTVSDHAGLEATSDGSLVIDAEGDTDTYEGTYDDTDARYTPTSDVRSLFSLDYLTDMVDAFDADSDVTIQLGDEFPLFLKSTITHGVGDDERDVGSVRYMLAPRIQSE